MTQETTMAASPENANDAVSAETRQRGLPRWLFVGILLGVIGLFLLVQGPIWRNPWNAGLLDAAIYWSYLPIPFLVAAGLLACRRFSFRFLFLESLAITLIKYGATFSLAMVFWALSGPPPKVAPPPPPPRAVAQPAPPPPPTPIPPDTTGEVHGTVTNAASEPLSGVLVWVASGLEAFVFERPSDPLHVENDGTKVRTTDGPKASSWPDNLVVVRAGQTLLGRSLDGHLHTLVASGGSTGTTFNIPMMSSGVWSTLVVREPARPSRLLCTVHPQGEEPAYLAVIEHPFFTVTDEKGVFKISGVPESKITLAAFHASAGEASGPVRVAAGKETALDLRVQPTQ